MTNSENLLAANDMRNFLNKIFAHRLHTKVKFQSGINSATQATLD